MKICHFRQYKIMVQTENRQSDQVSQIIHMNWAKIVYALAPMRKRALVRMTKLRELAMFSKLRESPKYCSYTDLCCGIDAVTRGEPRVRTILGLMECYPDGSFLHGSKKSVSGCGKANFALRTLYPGS
ncbi:hypothetical protein BELL_0086g00250 [Botrytis elliptica]|uniref:Uncharacterized protein n=1 Tax=Botrytis elliptica TaxID=278938 RepID=A0A4Z1JVK6_9HELO|nr:hypothetical protein BELL_0086g00250 [Botrytis elliptica]